MVKRKSLVDHMKTMKSEHVQHKHFNSLVCVFSHPRIITVTVCFSATWLYNGKLDQYITVQTVNVSWRRYALLKGIVLELVYHYNVTFSCKDWCLSSTFLLYLGTLSKIRSHDASGQLGVQYLGQRSRDRTPDPPIRRPAVTLSYKATKAIVFKSF